MWTPKFEPIRHMTNGTVSYKPHYNAEGRRMTPSEDPFLWLALWMSRFTTLDLGLRCYIVRRVTELVFYAHQINCGGLCQFAYLCNYCKEYGRIGELSPVYYVHNAESVLSFRWFFRQGTFKVPASATNPPGSPPGYSPLSPIYGRSPPLTPTYASFSPQRFAPTSPESPAKRARLNLDLDPGEEDDANDAE